MNKEFIPYEQALALKELGFDEKCLAAYFVFGDGKLRNGRYGQTEPQLFINGIGKQLEDREEELEMFAYHDLSVPLYQQAFRWFREKYGYDIHVRGTNFRASYVIGVPKEINMKSFDGYPLVISWDYIIDETGITKTYEEAELECLKKLIEIVKKD